MSSAQVGKTELLLNIIGYFIDYDPSPILLLQPTLEMAQTFSKDRLAPMLRDTPALKGKVADSKSKSSGNTMLHKTFPGGHITMAGANSPASLASRPIRILLADEVDRYPASAGTEGDPVNLAKKRTTTFWNRKIVQVSTPTIKGVSRIERSYEDSTQEIFCLPCPSCGDYQQIRRQHLQHEKEAGQLVEVRAACEHCGSIHTENEWKGQSGRWIAQATHAKTRGFHLNEYISPWRKWVDIETDFLQAKKSPETLKTFVNTSLGETWEDEGESVEHNALYLRREFYDQVPDGGLVLVAGVDVQDDRIEGEVVAYGEDFETWGIEYFVLHGDPGRPQLWEQLQTRLNKQYVHHTGDAMTIAAACIDSGGHYTQQVYDFCKRNAGRRIWAVKGSSERGKPIIATRGSKANKGKVKLFTIGTDTAKELVYSRLKIAEPGPGFCHFPQSYDEEYFLQLTAEKRTTKYVKGFPRLEWQKTRPRNEALDCRVYALAAITLLNPVFSAIKKKLEHQPEEQKSPEKTETPTEKIIKVRKTRGRRSARRGGYVSKWR